MKGEYKQSLSKFLNYEWLVSKNYILYCLQQKKTLGDFFKSTPNKLINLKIAHLCGLKIPDTIITERSTVLHEIVKTGDEYITKPIGEAMAIYSGKGHYSIYTSEVNNINQSIDNFFPSLYQKKIEKKYEIRVFVLYDKLFSCAIFSQNNEKTLIDYRNYDNNRMNRIIPYNLPENIESNILRFMKKVDLNTGSIDLIKSIDDEYYFLEINPCGNIEMVSDPCNYNLDEIIAETIIKEMKNEK